MIGTIPDDEVKATIVLPTDRGKKAQKNAATGVSAASARAIAARAMAFYFRAPVKAFFRTRVDYMAFARAINPQLKASEAWSWKTTTPGIFSYAIQTHGWGFVPRYIIPPLFANIFVGSVLYTSYLATLSMTHPTSSAGVKRQYPPPSPSATFTAGFVVGTLQSLVASPLDALHVRFKAKDMLDGRYSTIWQYAWLKTREIGVRRVFAGWTLSFLKDSLGCTVFFGTFEAIKSQGFYTFVRWYYSDIQQVFSANSTKYASYKVDESTGTPTIKPHYALEPIFLLLAGLSAAVTQSLIQYPLNLIQDIHYNRLDALDARLTRESTHRPPIRKILQDYRHAYVKTWRQCNLRARSAGCSLTKWVYKGFAWNTLRSMPGTSAGLILFELIRRRYADLNQEIRINIDGFNVLFL